MLFIFDIIFSLYENWLFLHLIKKQIRDIKNISFLYDISAIFVTTLSLLLIQYLQLPIPDIFPFFIFFIYIKLISSASFFKCALWTILDIILFMGTLSIIVGFLDMQVSINGVASIESDSTLLTYMIICNTILGIVVNIAMRFCKEENLLSFKETSLFVLMLLLCLIINECLFNARFITDNDNLLLAGSICTFVLTLFTMILYEWITKNIKKIHDYELSENTHNIVSEHQDELKSIYTKMLSEQHDLKHRITAIEQILSAEIPTSTQKEEVLALLSDSETPKLYITGNIAVDAIIRAKSIVMEENNIPFEFIEYPLYNLPISDTDFCMLLGNLLDNAIEAVTRLSQDHPYKKIKLRFHRAWDMFFISCENGVDPAGIKQIGGDFLSTKANTRLHGFGTKSNKTIVEKAGGTLEYEITAEKFIVKIMLGMN